MSNLNNSHLARVVSPDSGKLPGTRSRVFSEHPDLLVHLQDIKNKSRLSPYDFNMVFAELDVQVSELGLSEFEQEIDLLSMLFHLVFIDQELPEEIKSQLARLQINMLISVIQETGFIDHSSNPIRRLLETVVKTQVELIVSGNSDNTGVAILQRGIDKIVNCEIVDFSAYQELLDEYLNLANSPAKLETASQPADKAAEVTKTTQIVLSMMQEFTIPLQVQNKSTILFDKVWTPLLLQIALTDGLNSSSWIKSVQSVKAQVWALTPKTTLQGHQKLLTMITHISKSLARSMDLLKLSAKLQKSLKEYLVLEQAEVIRITEINIESLDQKPEPDGPAKQTDATSKKVTNQPVPPASTTKSKTEPKTQEIKDALQSEFKNQQEVETRVSEADKLKLGDWIEIKQDDSEILAKLTWRAEDSSLFIFVDREGNRIREVDGTTLDYEIATGQIKVPNGESNSALKSGFSYFDSI